LRENSLRLRGAAPRMNPKEAIQYLQKAIEKASCPSSVASKPVAFRKVDADTIPAEFLDGEYWLSITAAVAPYDPVCIEADCIETMEDWRDQHLIICGLAVAVFYRAPLAASIIGVLCVGATLGTYNDRVSSCSNPPDSWGCF
jgi:hypothetical protein